MNRSKVLLSCFLVVGGLARGQSQPGRAANPPQAGTINYVEGQASLNGQSLGETSVGLAKLTAGQALSTQNGRVEILLTPGVFLRVGNQSTVRMLSPDLANTIVTLEKGRAMVEVNDLYRENNIRVNENGASVQLTKVGLYDFDADRGQMRVFDGKADVQTNGRDIEVKGEHELNLTASGQLKAVKFDPKAYQDDFYRWASLRSSYLTEANIDSARRYAGGGGYAPALWYGGGWYWDPWFGAYTFIPGDGIFYSSFGWGFYSPWAVYGAPFIGGFGYFHHFGPGYFPRTRVAAGFAGHADSFRGSSLRAYGGGFRGGVVRSGGMGGFAGGGFHGTGGGGGFHGGGGGRR